MKFKVGDKVRCKKDIIQAPLKQDGIYIVEDKTTELLKLKGESVYYSPIRFELVEEKKKAEVWTGKQLENLLKFGISADKCIFNDKATILFYKSSLDYEPTNRKVVAKCQEGDKYTKEDGLRICVLKAMKREIERELKQY